MMRMGPDGMHSRALVDSPSFPNLESITAC
jgi:hypothetical protein